MLTDEREYLLEQIEWFNERLVEEEKTTSRLLRKAEKLKAENAVLVVALTALSLRGDQVGSTRR
jgi:ferritin